MKVCFTVPFFFFFRRGIFETEEKALKSLLQCLFTSRLFLSFPTYICTLCLSLVASCSFAVLEGCLNTISDIVGRMNDDSGYAQMRGILLDTLFQRSKGISPQLYLRFLLSTLLGENVEKFLSKSKSNHKPSNLFVKVRCCNLI